MLGIILKDYYESFCIKKNLIGFLFSIACLIFLTIFVQNMYALVLMVVITLPMISVSPLQYSLEQDEISNYDKILLTFPLTRKEIVSSKLLGTYIFAVLSNFCISLPILLIYVCIYQIADFQNGMWIFLFGVIMSLIMLPINNVGFFWLGNKKGTILYIVLLVVLAVSYIISNFSIGINQLLEISPIHWAVIGLGIATILNIIGYFACIKLYNKAHS